MLSSVQINVKVLGNVTSVKVDGVNLVKKANFWEGEYFISSETEEGNYTLKITAEDSSGNRAEEQVEYSVVFPEGGFAVTVHPMMSNVSKGEIKVFEVEIVSNENFDDKLHVCVSSEGIPDEYRTDFVFNWTDKTVLLPSKETVKIPLEVKIPNKTGYKMFRVYAESMKHRSYGFGTGIVMIS